MKSLFNFRLKGVPLQHLVVRKSEADSQLVIRDAAVGDLVLERQEYVEVRPKNMSYIQCKNLHNEGWRKMTVAAVIDLILMASEQATEDTNVPTR